MTAVTKKRLGFVAGFALYFGVIWFLWETPVVYPLKIFVVLLHEMSHALALLATGGRVESITLDPLQGGLTLGMGGSPFLTLSAGYLGSLLWGAAMVSAARSRRLKSELVVGLIGGIVLGLTILYVRGLFGMGFGFAFGAALIMASTRLSAVLNKGLLTVLGLTSCLYAVLDIKSDILDRPELQSDAAMLAELTGIPTVVYGVTWIALALFVCAMLFRSSLKKV